MTLRSLAHVFAGAFAAFTVLAACSSGPNAPGGAPGAPAEAETDEDPSLAERGAETETEGPARRGGASSSSGEGTAPPPPSAPVCATSDDCPYWYCECGSGPPVNTAHCTGGRCEDATTACPRSCKSFGTCWTGRASGGWDGGSNAGPDQCAAPPPPPPPPGNGCGDGSSFTDVGKGCVGDASCQSGQCWGVDGAFSCTKRCNSAAECPQSWRCKPTSAGYSVCLQGSLAAGGSAPSTNASCAQVTFSDIGGVCQVGTQCQSGICLNTGRCSRRCETTSDCPAGFSCKTTATVKLCAK